MTNLDRVFLVDSINQTVTVEAGIRVEALIQILAEDGLELLGGFDLQGRTVGGAIAAPCFGPCIGNAGQLLLQPRCCDED